MLFLLLCKCTAGWLTDQVGVVTDAYGSLQTAIYDQMYSRINSGAQTLR